MSHTTFILTLGPLRPWLILLLGLQALATRSGLKMRGPLRLALLGLLAAGLLMLPIRGFRIAEWVRGFGIDFSIPFTGLVAVAVWEQEFRRELFTKANWTTAWCFGAAAGLGLYPFALGWGSFDPYGWGWGFSPLFVISALLTAVLIWKRNRFGILLLLAIAAYHLRLLESANYWDCLLDPVYCLSSVVALGFLLLVPTRLRVGGEQHVADGVPGPKSEVW